MLRGKRTRDCDDPQVVEPHAPKHRKIAHVDEGRAGERVQSERVAGDTPALTSAVGKGQHSSPAFVASTRCGDGITMENQSDIVQKLTLPLGELTSATQFGSHFAEIARWLCQECVLVIAGHQHRIAEAEFYFTSEVHNDPFTHCMEEQNATATWYFHRSSPTAYKGGTYKGLDITIGQGEHGAGGILIRSLFSLADNEVICGPCKCVDHILELNGAASIDELVTSVMQGDRSVSGESSSLRLQVSQDKCDAEELVLSTPRFGLYMTKKGVPLSAQLDFMFAPYRFLVEPRRIAKGRQLLVLQMLGAGKTFDEINRVSGCTERVIDGYEKSFAAGQALQNLGPQFRKRLSVQDLSRAYGYYHASQVHEDDE